MKVSPTTSFLHYNKPILNQSDAEDIADRNIITKKKKFINGSDRIEISEEALLRLQHDRSKSNDNSIIDPKDISSIVELIMKDAYYIDDGRKMKVAALKSALSMNAYDYRSDSVISRTARSLLRHFSPTDFDIDSQ